MRKKPTEQPGAPAVVLQRMVRRWRKEARRMKQNAAHWGKDKKADKMRKELAIEWSIGLAQAFAQCADELEAANDPPFTNNRKLALARKSANEKLNMT